MTRYVIDAPTAIRLVKERITVAEHHQLVAPSLLRSQVLSILFRQVSAGDLSRAEALDVLDRVTMMRIRLLGDRVSRATAWRVAEQMGWPDTPDAEYVAIAQLQADALITVDADFGRRVAGAVPVAPLESLLNEADEGG